MIKNKIKNDVILVIVILIFALTVFLGFNLNLKSGNTALVTVNGEEIYTLSLNENVTKTVETKLGENIIEIKYGAVQIKSADCPDKICVEHREISKVGETIVCLPHKLVVEITEKG